MLVRKANKEEHVWFLNEKNKTKQEKKKKKHRKQMQIQWAYTQC